MVRLIPATTGATPSRFSEVRDSVNQLQSTNSTITQQMRRSNNQSLSVGFSRSDPEEPLKNFTVQFNARRGNSESERDVRNTFLSFTDNSKSTSINRLYNSNNQSLNLGGVLDYAGFKRLLFGRFNLFRISLRFAQSFNYNRLSDNTGVRDYDSVTKQYIANTTSLTKIRESFLNTHLHCPFQGLLVSILTYLIKA